MLVLNSDLYNLKTASSADYLSKNSVTVKYEPDSAKGEAQ